MKLRPLVWKLIQYRPKYYVISALIWNLFLISALLPGLFTRAIFEKLPMGDIQSNSVFILILLFVITSVFRYLTTYGAVATEVTFQYLASALIRKNIVNQIFKKPGARALNISSGDAVSRFRDDVAQIINLATDAPYVISQFLFTIFALIIMLKINWFIALCVVVPVLTIVLVVHYSSKLIEKYRRLGRLASGNVSEYLGEVFNSSLTIKVTGTEENFVKKLRNLNNIRRKAMRNDRLLNELLNSFSSNTVNIGAGLMILAGSRAIQNGTFSIGDFTLFINYLYYVTGLPVWLGRFLAQYKQTGVSMDRLQEMTDIKSSLELAEADERTSTQINSQATIHESEQLNEFEVCNLYYSHTPGRGIQNISFKLKRGSLTVITGEMGSGKTTLLRCVIGLLPLDKGSIYWNENKVEEPASHFSPLKTAYTPQVPHLFTDTIKDNIVMGRNLSEKKFRDAVQNAALEDDLAMMAEHEETKVGPKGMMLSGGQIQRVAAARMFAQDAELVIMDDVSSALDIRTEEKIWERVLQNTESTFLVVTHRPYVLKRADHIILLKDGKIHAEGNLEKLLDISPEMQQIWGENFEDQNSLNKGERTNG
ncbi:ABC transporter ATP-binding protein [Paenibacillus illinoisensis]|uniref:ABC transporter ATP-binding protein n=1 Tax=Paenibacillus illinoisensis TaxID=59845 RepID=UPI0030192DD5